MVTLVVVIRASKKNATADEYFTGGRAFSGPQNGIAIAGDYLSAASFLGIAGAIAVYGYDGFLYSIGFLVAWLVALLLVAELLRNTGKFTMADVLSFRLRQRRCGGRGHVDAGGVVLLPAGPDGRRRRTGRAAARHHEPHGSVVVIAVVGILMIVYVLVGGMKGTTWVQIIKAVLLIVGAGVMTVMVLAKFGFNFSEILGSAQTAISGHHRGRRRPRRAGPRRAVRRLADLADRLHLAGARAGAGHRGPAAHPDALLHRADRQGGPPLGGLGDRADRRLLPVHPGARATARRRWSARTGSSPRPAGRTRRLRCWPSSSAA